MSEQPQGRMSFSHAPALAIAGFFLFILAEVALLVFVSTHIGWWTLVALMISTVLGAYLLQREWRKAWKHLSQSLSTGHLPTGRTADAALVLMGGFMLIMPGFITDIVGLLLLLPFTRPGVRSVLGWWVGRAMSGQTKSPSNPGSSETLIEGEVVNDDDGSPAKGNIIMPVVHPRDEPEGS